MYLTIYNYTMICIQIVIVCICSEWTSPLGIKIGVQKIVPWGIFITFFLPFSISFGATDDIIMADRTTKMTTYPYPSPGTGPQ